MSARVRVVTCAGGAPWEAPLVRGLQRRELGVDVARRCVDLGELLGVALRDRPRAALVAAELPWLDRELVGTLHDHGVTVVAIEHGSPARSVERIGVAHRLPSCVTAEQLATLLHRLGPETATPGEREAGPVRGAPSSRAGAGRLVAVWGAPGSPGRTSVALHLALEATRTGVSALLVDGDVWSPSLAQLVEVDESPSVAGAARLAAEGWPKPLGSCLQEGPGGLRLLTGLPRAELWPELRERAWTAVLDAARELTQLVIVDLAAPIEEDEELAFDRVPYRRNLVTLRTLAEADTVLAVVRADPVGLRRGIEAHRTLGATRPEVAERVDTVLNRVPGSARRAQECSASLSEWTGRAPVALLPVEPAFERVVWEGRPLPVVHRRSSWMRELRVLAGLVAA